MEEENEGWNTFPISSYDRSHQLSARSMIEEQVASPLGHMESLTTLGALSGLPIEYGQGLEGIGWNVQRLGTLHDEEEAVIGEVLTSLEKKVGSPMEVEPLLGLIEVVQKAAEVAWRVEGIGRPARNCWWRLR